MNLILVPACIFTAISAIATFKASIYRNDERLTPEERDKMANIPAAVGTISGIIAFILIFVSCFF